MRKLFIALAIVFGIIGIATAILPLGTIGVLPVGICILFCLFAYIISNANEKKLPKWLLIISGITLILVIGKSFIPDEVAKDSDFEQRKIESKKEDLKDLEDLE